MNPYLVMKPISESYGITIGTTTPTPLPDIPTNAKQAKVQVEGGAIRIRFDGTASVTYGTGGGFLFGTNSNNVPFYLFKEWDTLDRMRILSDTSSVTAYVNILYEGEGQPE